VNQSGGPSETDLGKSLVDAAAEAGVRHFVYSGMASASEITGGSVPNKAFEGMFFFKTEFCLLIPRREACHWRVCQEQGCLRDCQHRQPWLVHGEPSRRGSCPCPRRIPFCS
jgi:hypothetical protein